MTGLRSRTTSTLRSECSGGETPQIEEAVKAYREVLQVRTRELVPLDWASIQDGLGNALGVLGDLKDETALLKEAVAAFCEALKERTRETCPSTGHDPE